MFEWDYLVIETFLVCSKRNHRQKKFGWQTRTNCQTQSAVFVFILNATVRALWRAIVVAFTIWAHLNWNVAKRKMKIIKKICFQNSSPFLLQIFEWMDFWCLCNTNVQGKGVLFRSHIYKSVHIEQLFKTARNLRNFALFQERNSILENVSKITSKGTQLFSFTWKCWCFSSFECYGSVHNAFLWFLMTSQITINYSVLACLFFKHKMPHEAALAIPVRLMIYA